MRGIVLQPKERIEREVHQHMLRYWHWWLLSALLLGSAAFFMFYLLGEEQWGIWVFALLALGGGWLFFRTLVQWRGTRAIVTTHRLMDLVKTGFFSHDMSEILYSDIVNVHLKRKGIGSLLLRYGDVIIEIGDEEYEIVLPKVRKPHMVVQLIDALREQHMNRAGQVQQSAIGVVKAQLDELSLKELKRIRNMVHIKIKSLQEK